MAISYVKIARTPYIFRQLTGLTTSEFEKNCGKSASRVGKNGGEKEMSRKKIAC